MTSTVVVDDHLLVLHLAGVRSWLPSEAVLATTASWWFRVNRAVERAGGGSLTRLIGDVASEDRSVVEGLLHELPPEVEVLHPRNTVPNAAALSARHGLNLLAADALATATVLQGRIMVSSDDEGPMLRSAAGALGIGYEVVRL